MKGVFDMLYLKKMQKRRALGRRMPLSPTANQVKRTIWLGAKHCGKYVKFLFPLLNWEIVKTFTYITGSWQSVCYFLSNFFNHKHIEKPV